MQQIAYRDPSRELSREFALVRIRATGSDQDQALDRVGKWSARLLELNDDQVTVELCTDPRRLDAFLDEVQLLGVVTVTRSGELRI